MPDDRGDLRSSGMSPSRSPIAGSHTITVGSVNVGLPTPIGERTSEPVMSSIAKQRVAAGTTLWLSQLNLAGDAQADLSVHGGPDKAVYAYPSEHLPWWADELDADLGTAAFGENLSTVGVTEDDVGIGDVWSWGDALLEVCQPRTPCFKLALHRGKTRHPGTVHCVGAVGVVPPRAPARRSAGRRSDQGRVDRPQRAHHRRRQPRPGRPEARRPRTGGGPRRPRPTRRRVADFAGKAPLTAEPRQKSESTTWGWHTRPVPVSHPTMRDTRPRHREEPRG